MLDEPDASNSSPIESATTLYSLSASKTLLGRLPGFPTFQKSGLTKQEYVRLLRSHLENISGNEASSEGSDSSSESAVPREYNVCPCDDEKYLEALQQNQDLITSESEFDSANWYSSGYSSSEDEPYRPHLGVSEHKFPVTSDEDSDQNRKLRPEELYNEDEDEEEDEEAEELEETEEEDELIQPKKKQKLPKFLVPLDSPLEVLVLPPWRSGWTVKKRNSMRPVLNNFKLSTLSFF